MSPPSRRGRLSGARLLVAALAVAAVAVAGRAALRVSHGLSAEYFTNVDRSGVAAFTAVDAEASTSALARRWRNAPPETFSARWRGYLAVGRSGPYRFATTSWCPHP